RLKLDPAASPWNRFYRLLTDVVQPRPIALVSSVDATGRSNLAPFSFFNAVCAKPPILAFSPMRQGKTGSMKDTLNNIRSQREYVIATVTEDLVQRVNQASFEYGPEVSEFDAAGFTKLPAEKIRPALVADSPVNFECILKDILEYGDGPGGGALVV